MLEKDHAKQHLAAEKEELIKSFEHRLSSLQLEKEQMATQSKIDKRMLQKMSKDMEDLKNLLEGGPGGLISDMSTALREQMQEITSSTRLKEDARNKTEEELVNQLAASRREKEQLIEHIGADKYQISEILTTLKAHMDGFAIQAPVIYLPMRANSTMTADIVSEMAAQMREKEEQEMVFSNRRASGSA